MKESTKTLAKFLTEADAEALRQIEDAEDADAIIVLAREHGHDVSGEDLHSLARGRQFAKAVEENQELRAKLEGATDADAVVRIAGEHGCPIEHDDLEELRELSDEQLERVAGGVARYNFYEGWPCKWYVPEMAAGRSGMAIEKIELAVEKVERG